MLTVCLILILNLGLRLCVQGALAVWRLLRKTKTLPSTSKRYRNHARKGNYMTALRDFFELDPAKVKQTTGKWGRVYEGRIGDKTIILRSKGEYPPHEPELIINDRKAQHFESGTQYSDWIIYKQNIDDL